MRNLYAIIIFTLLFSVVKSQCITGTPPTLTCGTPITVADNSPSGSYGTASQSAPACRTNEKYTYSDLYRVTYQPGMVINVNCELYIGFLEVLSDDGCTSFGCNMVDASGVNIIGESFVQDNTSLNGVLRQTIGLDGLGLTSGNTYLIKWASIANCGGSTCTSATIGISRGYVISCHTTLANACENNVGLSGNTTYNITNQYTSDDHSNLNVEGSGCGYSIEDNLIYRWCTDALNTQVQVQLSNVTIHTGPSIQFAILSNNCGGIYSTIMCQSGITGASTFNITGTAANTCYWITLDGNGGTWFTTDIRLVNSIILPIELISFDGYRNNNTAKLKWTTASEINNDRFEILRSYDGVVFEKAGEVRGVGNSSTILNYEFLDYLNYDGIIYYKLNQIDYNGSESYSNIIYINSLLDKENKTILKKTNILGQEVGSEYDGPAFIFYNDGSVIRK